jgi:translation initiation factor 2B subunit (eIF-2B alpha/beta/delta family)
MQLIKDLEKRYLVDNITNPIIRCVMLIDTIFVLFKENTDIINDNKINKAKWLKTIIKPISKYLSASSKNILNYINTFLIKNVPINEMITEINNFIDKNIYISHNKIIETTIERLGNNNNILISGNNPLINNIIYSFKNKNKSVKISICDNPSNPSLKCIIKNTTSNYNYLHLNALSYIISTIDVVLLGCNEVMSNGDIIGPIGTALVSLIAHNNNIPVIVCSETLSLTKKVQTGINFDIIKHNTYKKCILEYDITPSKFIHQIINERGIIHPLAVHNFKY